MVATLIILYGILVAANYFYSRTKKQLPSSLNYIVILSGDFNWDTLNRVERGIKLWKQFPEATIVICGKDKSKLMQKRLRERGVNRYVIQNKSTNTLEDAQYLLPLLPNKAHSNLGLVTSNPHHRRAYHTYRKVFRDYTIYNFPANDLTNIYSPFLPTGWFANLLNIYKDWKYNGTLW